MPESIAFRIHLSRNRDWDAVVREFRCPALAIPGASVSAVHSDGLGLPSDAYLVDRSTHSIRLLRNDPPEELIVRIELSATLTKRSSAAALGGGVAIVVATIAGLFQFLTAVVPAKLHAEETQNELSAARSAVEECRRLREAERALPSGRASSPLPPPAAPPASSTVTTRGDYSPVLQGDGHITFNAGREP